MIPIAHDLRQRVPHLDQWLGLWAMDERAFCGLAHRLASLDLHVHLSSDAPELATATAAEQRRFLSNDGVAVIEIEGRMMKHVSSLGDGTSTVLARRAIRSAAADPDVAAILLRIDSPGGTVAGTQDLADEVAAAAKKKPTQAFIEDACASAAYWIASQTDKIWANPTALIGSIGTYGVVQDLSQMAENEGVKVHVVRAGDFKGMGAPGTAVTSEQLAEFQRIVTEVNDHFLRGVAQGRKMEPSAVRAIADGRVHLAKPAVGMGLIDGVKSLDEVLSGLSRKKGKRMNQTDPAVPVKAAAASFEDLKLLCPGADNDFLCAQLGRKATADQAQSAWMDEQNKRIESARKEAADAKAAAAKPGVEALKTAKLKADAEDDSEPIAQWNAAVAAKVRSGLPRHLATAAVARERPELREAIVEQANRKAG